MIIHSKRRQLSEEFATAARLYAEAVVSLTSDSGASAHDYYRLRDNVQKSKQRAESAGIAFQEYVEPHQREEKVS
jgi:hypothetical protein